MSWETKTNNKPPKTKPTEKGKGLLHHQKGWKNIQPNALWDFDKAALKDII